MFRGREPLQPQPSPPLLHVFKFGTESERSGWPQLRLASRGARAGLGDEDEHSGALGGT